MSTNSDINNEERYSVPGLARGLYILEYLSMQPEGKTQKEIAEALKYPLSSVSRITLQLVDMGYLFRDPATKIFSSTMKMLLVGQQALTDSDLVGTALPVMRRLRDRLQDTVLLGVLNGTEIVVIESAPGTHLFKFTVNPGHRINIPASAPGKAIVANLPEDERRQMLDKLKFVKFNENTITSRKDFERELDTVRKQGYSLDRGEEYLGIYCVGGPLFDRNGFPIASIWVTGPGKRVSPDQYPAIGKIIKEGCEEISRMMGYNVMPKN